jgi:hypothetical protein
MGKAHDSFARSELDKLSIKKPSIEDEDDMALAKQKYSIGKSKSPLAKQDWRNIDH